MRNSNIRFRTAVPQLSESNGQYYAIAEETGLDINDAGFPVEQCFTMLVKLGKDETKAQQLLNSFAKNVLPSKTIVRIKTDEPRYKGHREAINPDTEQPMGYYYDHELASYEGTSFQVRDLTTTQTLEAVVEATGAEASADADPAF